MELILIEPVTILATPFFYQVDPLAVNIEQQMTLKIRTDASACGNWKNGTAHTRSKSKCRHFMAAAYELEKELYADILKSHGVSDERNRALISSWFVNSSWNNGTDKFKLSDSDIYIITRTTFRM